MSKFFDRFTGTYVETDMVIFTYVDKLLSTSSMGYKKCYIQFKRGEQIERSQQTFDVQKGDQQTSINQIFQKQSVFYKKKDSRVAEYQEKLLEIRIFGTADNGIPTCLGSKVLNVANYAGRKKHRMEFNLDQSPFAKSTLHMQMTIVPIAESKSIT